MGFSVYVGVLGLQVYTPPLSLTGIENHEALVDPHLRGGEPDTLRRVHKL